MVKCLKLEYLLSKHDIYLHNFILYLLSMLILQTVVINEDIETIAKLFWLSSLDLAEYLTKFCTDSWLKKKGVKIEKLWRYTTMTLDTAILIWEVQLYPTWRNQVHRMSAPPPFERKSSTPKKIAYTPTIKILIPAKIVSNILMTINSTEGNFSL